VLLGDDLLPLLVLALGGAMVFGNLLAIVKPRTNAKPGELERAPLGRSVGMALIGGIAFIWALASLVKG
jgi:hypothetical protein